MQGESEEGFIENTSQDTGEHTGSTPEADVRQGRAAQEVERAGERKS